MRCDCLLPECADCFPPKVVCPVTKQRWRLTISYKFGPKIVTFHEDLVDLNQFLSLGEGQEERITKIVIDNLAAEAASKGAV